MATVRMTQTMAGDIEVAAMKAWHNTNPSPEKNLSYKLWFVRQFTYACSY